MLTQLQKEAEEDEEIYDLTTKIEELTANSARLSTEIKNLEAEIAKLQEGLDKATAIREKELAEFNEEEKDLLESITALKSAIVVLSKHHSLLQVPKTHVLSIAATLQHELSKHAELLSGVLTHKQRREVVAFAQAPDFFDAEPTFKQSYAPASGEIFG